MNPVPPQTRIRMMTSHFSDYRNIRSAFALGGGRGRLPGTDEALHAGAQAQHLVQRRGDRRSISSVQMPSDSIRRNVSCTRSWVSGDSSSKPGSAIRSRSICEVGSNSRCLRSRTMVRSSSPDVGGGVEVVAPVAGSAAAADQAPVQQFLEAVADIERAAFRVSAISSAFSGLPWKRAARGSARPSGSRPSCCPCLPSGE